MSRISSGRHAARFLSFAIGAAFAGARDVQRRGYHLAEDRVVTVGAFATIGCIALWQTADAWTRVRANDELRSRLVRDVAAWPITPDTKLLSWSADFPFDTWVRPFQPLSPHDRTSSARPTTASHLSLTRSTRRGERKTYFGPCAMTPKPIWSMGTAGTWLARRLCWRDTCTSIMRRPWRWFLCSKGTQPRSLPAGRSKKRLKDVGSAPVDNERQPSGAR